jgi:hypothetical protein
MNSGRTVFAQIMATLPLRHFHRCVDRYQGDYKVKSFCCLDQFLALAFAQLTYRESLRDIEACLRAMQPRLYHMGFRCSQVPRNTLAHANEARDGRIYADFAQHLIAEARALYAHTEDLGLALDQTAFALDSTLIDLCLSLFPWAPHQRSKAGVKVHTLLDMQGSIPAYLHISGAHTSDVSVLDHIPLEAGSIYVMDRGYIHFKRLYALTTAAVFFVARARENMRYRPATLIPWTRPRACARIKPSFSPVSILPTTIPRQPGASISSTKNITMIWCFLPIIFRFPR